MLSPKSVILETSLDGCSCLLSWKEVRFKTRFLSETIRFSSILFLIIVSVVFRDADSFKCLISLYDFHRTKLMRSEGIISVKRFDSTIISTTISKAVELFFQMRL